MFSPCPSFSRHHVTHKVRNSNRQRIVSGPLHPHALREPDLSPARDTPRRLSALEAGNARLLPRLRRDARPHARRRGGVVGQRGLLSRREQVLCDRGAPVGLLDPVQEVRVEEGDANDGEAKGCGHACKRGSGSVRASMRTMR